MATIVTHRSTGKRYVLLGTGFGAFRSKTPNWLLGDLAPDTEDGQHTMACVCDEGGRMRWIDSMALTVESVDGESPSDLLA